MLSDPVFLKNNERRNRRIMRKVTVNASKKYDILIGSGLLCMAGEMIKQVAGGSCAAIISDSNVAPLHMEKVKKTLEGAGYRVETYVFEAGESNKNIDTFEEILNFFADSKLDRTDVVAALGGGVTGDMAGFAASVYLRGIHLVQLPTTVLAAVDSSVGGKTAINLPAGKNLAGAFYQPELVICDTDTFATLPDREYKSGFAEIIKYAVIAQPKLLDMINSSDVSIDEIIELCVKIKRDIVEADEFEKGQRQLLNFGHTIGHAVEKASDFELLHGEAVAIGMVMMAKAAVKKGICIDKCLEDIIKACETVGLPVSADYSHEVLMNMICSDKKVRGNTINVILPEHAGKCNIENITIEEMSSLLDMALKK